MQWNHVPVTSFSYVCDQIQQAVEPIRKHLGFDTGLFAHCLIGSAPLPEIYWVAKSSGTFAV